MLQMHLYSILYFFFFISAASSKSVPKPALAPTKAPPNSPTWSLQTRLAHGIGNEFGSSVSIVKNMLLVGAENENFSGKSSGMAYIYERKAGIWRLQQKFTPGKRANSQNFGRSVSLSSLRNVFAVGAPGLSENSVWIYARQNGSWVPQQAIPGPKNVVEFGGIVALFHDTIITVGVFSLLGLQFDLTIVAALLTIIGYSINDTVIIYDRIRENLKKDSSSELSILVNESLNNTLSRTLKTSGTTLLSIIAVLIFGGEVLRGFAFAITFGIIIGTYSSIYIASPIVMFFKVKRDWSVKVDNTP
jgi:hypothetical protein